MISLYVNRYPTRVKIKEIDESEFNIESLSKVLKIFDKEYLSKMTSSKFFTLEKNDKVLYKIGRYRDDNERNYSVEEYWLCISGMVRVEKFTIFKKIYIQDLLESIIQYEIHTTTSFVERCSQLSYGLV